MRTWLIAQSLETMQAIANHCKEYTGDNSDLKKLKILGDNHNRNYKKMTLVEQAEFHHEFIEWMKLKG